MKNGAHVLWDNGETKHARVPPSTLMSVSGTRRPLDRVFEALSHPARRHVLEAVNSRTDDEEDVVPVGDVVLEAAEPERMRVELSHTHLPKLADFGYVSWTREVGHVRRGPNFSEIAPILELLDAHHHELPGAWP